MAEIDALKRFPGPWEAGDSETRIPIKSAGRTIAYVQLRPGDGDVAAAICALPKLITALAAAAHALRSYEYGNAATDLAKGIADSADAALNKARGLA
jgi:hypothetical protein